MHQWQDIYSWTMNLLFLTPLHPDTRAWYITLITAVLQSIESKVVCIVLLLDKLCNDDTVSKLEIFTAWWTVFY